MRATLVGLGSAVLTVACGPEPASTDHETSDSSSTLADEGTRADTDSASGDDEATDESEADSEDTDEVRGCGDGIAAPGELCFELHTLEGLTAQVGQLLVHDSNGDAQLDVLAIDVAICPDIIGPQYARSQVPLGGSQLVNSGVGGMTWPLGPGASFGPPIGFAESLASAAAVGTVVVDGNADLLFADGRFSQRLPGDGAGGFGPAIPIQLPNQYLAQFADLDGDGLLDIVGVDNPEIIAARSDGAGDFTIHESELGSPVHMLRVVDLDGDPFPDLLAANTDELRPFFGVGDGTFEIGVPIVVEGLRTFELADFDDDGLGDVVQIAGDFFDLSLGVRLGGGDGSFSDPLWSRPVTSTSLFLGRFDGDAALDIGIQDDGVLEVHFGDGSGGVRDTGSMEIDGYIQLVEELNGDGIDDLIGASPEHDKVVVYLSNP